MRPLIVLLIAAFMAGGAPVGAQSVPDPVASVRAFAEQYLRDAPSLVAHEDYVQTSTIGINATHQVTTAELVMVRLPGPGGWVTYRDVLTVDKQPVRGREARLLTLLQSPEPTAHAQARKIAQESARFNLGRITRTMNVPDIALDYLHPKHGDRIRFETLRNQTIDGRPVIGLKFRELAGPSIIRSVSGRDLLAGGRVWAEPESGAIVRTELLLEDRGSNGSCMVDFGVEPRLGIRVPIKMTERYSVTGQIVDAVATYSNFRSFAVSTSEKVGKPPGR